MQPLPFSPRAGLLALTACLLVLAGCTTRSISNSGYQPYGNQNPFYKGELSEFDVVGLDRGATVTDAEIAGALDHPQTVRLRKGSAGLLIQSGAYLPDGAMVTDLSPWFTIVPFTGQPWTTNGATYSRALRLAAAQGGCATIICYWGALESTREGAASKSVSWLPVVGGLIPDETQQMRIRLKIALVDVRTGAWTIFTSTSFTDTAMSGEHTREGSDQTQVEKLKLKAYHAAAEEIVQRYAQ